MAFTGACTRPSLPSLISVPRKSGAPPLGSPPEHPSLPSYARGASLVAEIRVLSFVGLPSGRTSHSQVPAAQSTLTWPFSCPLDPSLGHMPVLDCSASGQPATANYRGRSPLHVERPPSHMAWSCRPEVQLRVEQAVSLVGRWLPVRASQYHKRRSMEYSGTNHTATKVA